MICNHNISLCNLITWSEKPERQFDFSGTRTMSLHHPNSKLDLQVMVLGYKYQLLLWNSFIVFIHILYYFWFIFLWYLMTQLNCIKIKILYYPKRLRNLKYIPKIEQYTYDFLKKLKSKIYVIDPLFKAGNFILRHIVFTYFWNVSILLHFSIETRWSAEAYSAGPTRPMWFLNIFYVNIIIIFNVWNGKHSNLYFMTSRMEWKYCGKTEYMYIYMYILYIFGCRK